MRGRFVPVLVSSLFVLSALAGCIGGGGGGGAKTNDGTNARIEEPPLTDTTGAIEGFVADASFNLFIGALVAITADGVKILKNVTTDDSGQYYAGGLVPGEYKVFATYTDHKPQGKSVIVVAGEASTLNFVLEPLPRVEPRMELPLELNFFIECGWGGPGVNGDGAVSCGNAQNSNQNIADEFHISHGLTTMIAAAKWSGVCTGCRDGKPWLTFQLFGAAGTKFKEWKAAPPQVVERFDFNLTEETQEFIYGDDGNWTLKVLPSSGNQSALYDQNGGLVSQMRIDAWVTLAYDNFYVPPEHTGFPDQ